MRHSQSGMSLVETMIVVALILIGLATIVVPQAQRAAREGDAQAFVQGMQSMVSRIRTAYQTRDSYSGIDYEGAQANGWVPIALEGRPADEGAGIEDAFGLTPWGSTWEISATSVATGTTADAFEVEVANIRYPEICLGVVEGLLDVAVTMSVGSTALLPPAPAARPPLSTVMSDAWSACGAVGDDPTAFRFATN